jgi:hypothetical protein
MAYEKTSKSTGKPGNFNSDRPHSYGIVNVNQKGKARADQSENPQQRQMPPEFEEEQEDSHRPKMG